MNNAETSTVLNGNHHTININLEGISHDESLFVPQHGGSCINWMLGHILVSRDVIMSEIGLKKLCDDGLTALYKRGAAPFKPEKAAVLGDLLKKYNESQDMILNCLKETRLEDKKQETVAFLAFHEAYHAGQIGILRRLIGKEGIIK